MSNDANRVIMQHLTIYRPQFGMNLLQYGETVTQGARVFHPVLIKNFSTELSAGIGF